MSHSKTERLNGILSLWNTGTISMREIAVEFDIPRNTVARILYDARRRGLRVIACTPSEAARRVSDAKTR